MGNNSSALKIFDAVSASVPGETSAAAIITRLPAVGTGNRLRSLYIGTNSTTTSTTFSLGSPSEDCILYAKVTTDDGSTPVAGVTVTFGIVTGGGSILPTTIPPLTATTATTDDNGIATAVFTGPGGATGGDAVVQAYISGTNNGGGAVGIIYWTDKSSGGVNFNLSSQYSTVNAGSSSILTATLTDNSGHGISGQTVTFSVLLNGSGGSFTTPPPLTAVTNGSGEAILIWTTGSGTGKTDDFQATVTYGSYIYTGITYVQTW